jgi:hypothetical protein
MFRLFFSCSDGGGNGDEGKLRPVRHVPFILFMHDSTQRGAEGRRILC